MIDEVYTIAQASGTSANAAVREAESRIAGPGGVGDGTAMSVESGNAGETSGGVGADEQAGRERVFEVYRSELSSVDKSGMVALRGSIDPYEDLGEESQDRAGEVE
ncbi:MAG: hypothetical protein Q4E01_04565 [Actinomycetaceae bacterium]|nr:hypothetical protein [Actinomycetaceae bacterium]